MKPAVDDVLWTQVRDLNPEWIRVVVVKAWDTHENVIVRPLFSGDAHAREWSVRREDLRTEQPTFDEIDTAYDGDNEFDFA